MERAGQMWVWARKKRSVLEDVDEQHADECVFHLKEREEKKKEKQSRSGVS